ncbi:MAG TPA: glycosyltransferase [Bryobacteraceae bacterium]|nr:glycosyltransferase [Bryobacteraceae bacterium]
MGSLSRHSTSLASARVEPASSKRWEKIPGQPQLRVCLVIDSLGPSSGNEILVARLANGFDPAVIEAHVCCFEASERLSRLRPHVRTAVFPLTRVNSFAGVRQMLRFYRYLKQNRIDAVHSFMNNSAMFSVLTARAAGCRAVITSRLNCGYVYTRRLIRIFRVLNRFSTHVLANSAAAKKVAAEVEKIPLEKITVFYPGVDLEKFAPSRGVFPAGTQWDIPLGAPVVGIVANFRPVKDLALFLRSAAVVLRSVPHAAFLVVGQEGPLKPALEKLAAELGIAERVFFSSAEVPVADYLARMSVACLSSQSESLPNAILEYMATGLPVVATDVGGVEELVSDGVNGFLVRTRTAEAFAEPIIRLLQDENLRAAMGLRGLKRARTEFEIAASVARLEQFYIEAAGGH